MTVTFNIDIRKLEQNPGLNDWYQRFARELLRNAQHIAAERIHGGTGAYERGFRFELIPGQPPKLVFGNITKHAGFLEFGTEAHGPILPKNKKALRWFDPPGGGQGAAVFATRVDMIPAMPAKNIIRDAVSRTADSLHSRTLF